MAKNRIKVILTDKQKEQLRKLRNDFKRGWAIEKKGLINHCNQKGYSDRERKFLVRKFNRKKTKEQRGHEYDFYVRCQKHNKRVLKRAVRAEIRREARELELKAAREKQLQLDPPSRFIDLSRVKLVNL